MRCPHNRANVVQNVCETDIVALSDSCSSNVAFSPQVIDTIHEPSLKVEAAIKVGLREALLRWKEDLLVI